MIPYAYYYDSSIVLCQHKINTFFIHQHKVKHAHSFLMHSTDIVFGKMCVLCARRCWCLKLLSDPARGRHSQHRACQGAVHGTGAGTRLRRDREDARRAGRARALYLRAAACDHAVGAAKAEGGLHCRDGRQHRIAAPSGSSVLSASQIIPVLMCATVAGCLR